MWSLKKFPPLTHLAYCVFEKYDPNTYTIRKREFIARGPNGPKPNPDAWPAYFWPLEIYTPGLDAVDAAAGPDGHVYCSLLVFANQNNNIVDFSISLGRQYILFTVISRCSLLTRLVRAVLLCRCFFYFHDVYRSSHVRAYSKEFFR